MGSPMTFDPTVVPDYQGQPNQLGGLARLAGAGTPNFERPSMVANSINAIARMGQQPPNMTNQLMPQLIRAVERRQQSQGAQVAQATPPGTPAVPNPAESTDDMIKRITQGAPSAAEVDRIINQGGSAAGSAGPSGIPNSGRTYTPDEALRKYAPEPQSPPGSPPGTPPGSREVPNPDGTTRWMTPDEIQQNNQKFEERYGPLRGGTPGPQASADDGPHGFSVNTAGSPHQGDTNGQLNIHVTPTDDQMLHWNKTYEQQPDGVQANLATMYPGRDMAGKTGSQLYNQDVGNEMVTNGTMYSQARQGVSQYYHDNGIPGSILQDGNTKSATVFHPSNISYSANGYQLEPVDYTPNFKQGGAIDAAIPRQVQSTVYPNTPASEVPPPPAPFLTPTAIPSPQ